MQFTDINIKIYVLHVTLILKIHSKKFLESHIKFKTGPRRVPYPITEHAPNGGH